MHQHPAVTVCEAMSGLAIVGTLLGYAPQVAALMAAVFYVVRIWYMVKGKTDGE